MKKPKDADKRVAVPLKEAKTVTSIEEVIQKIGISKKTFCSWKNTYKCVIFLD
jgi:transposase